jgi:hypothetical protein
MKSNCVYIYLKRCKSNNFCMGCMKSNCVYIYLKKCKSNNFCMGCMKSNCVYIYLKRCKSNNFCIDCIYIFYNLNKLSNKKLKSIIVTVSTIS